MCKWSEGAEPSSKNTFNTINEKKDRIVGEIISVRLIMSLDRSRMENFVLRYASFEIPIVSVIFAPGN